MVIESRAMRGQHSLGGFALAELMISTAIFSTISAALLMGFVSLKKNYVATTDFAVNHADQMRISDYLAMDFRRATAVWPPVKNKVLNDISVYIPCYYDPSGTIPWMAALDGTGYSFYLPVRSGSGAPDATLGADGDYYVDQTANQVYGPKAAGQWGLGAPLVIRNGSGAPAASFGADGDFYVDIDAPDPSATPPRIPRVYGRKSGGSWGPGTPLLSRMHYYLSGDIIYRQQDTANPVILARNVGDFEFNPDDPNSGGNAGKVVTTKITFRPRFRSAAGNQDTRAATAFYNTTLLRNNRSVY
jgi:hypothetical protein